MIIDILAVFRCINEEGWQMETIKDENIRKMLLELAESLHYVYGEKLKYEKWRNLSPFYRNVAEEGIILYAA